MCVRIFKSVIWVEISHAFLLLAHKEPNSAPSGKRSSGLAAETGSFAQHAQTRFSVPQFYPPSLCFFCLGNLFILVHQGHFSAFVKVHAWKLLS